ncbi:glycosyltransferase [Acaryochloris sp. IP29b_bin.137]|uniref:glycosyltransferase family protein n=1 Tax=Acaryochloris sp. IP29b_bin.137 TaxID=2969217 RepID=UPI002634078B|nr:glycosyltransferase [Acaryochloris sp. IP29b_bin.137]
MKIGFLHKVNTTPPQRGGSVHTYQLSHYLARQGHQLLALDNEQGSQFSDCFSRSLSGLRALISQSDLLYLRIDGRVGWEVASLVPGLVKPGQPIIWEVNSTLDELKVLPNPMRWRDRIGLFLRAFAARSAKAALCVSAPLVEYAQDIGIQSAELVPNGSDPEMFTPALSDPTLFPGLENKFRVLWAGSTNYVWHDFDLVLNCARRLEETDICFIVLGAPPRQLSGAIPTNLHFVPPVPYLEVPKYFASAHVGLSLYRTIDWTKYGFFFSPLKLFDYAASGLPVVYTNLPELDRVAAPFGRKVDVGDVQGLAHTLRDLQRDRSLYEWLSDQARRSVLDYYNWNRVGQQTEQLIQTLIAAT